MAEYYDELHDGDKSELETLKSALMKHFMPKEARRFYYADLYSRKQNELESTDDFGRAIQLLMLKCRAYAEMPIEHQDTLMCEHFVNGLRPDLKRMVLISDPKTFTQALDLAKREEIQEQITNRSAPWVKPKFSHPTYAVATSPVAAITGEQNLNARMDCLESVVEKLAMTLAESSVSKRQDRRFGGRGRYGRRHEERNLRSSNRRPICNYCKRVGHVEAVCNTKRNGQNSKN